MNTRSRSAGASCKPSQSTMHKSVGDFTRIFPGASPCVSTKGVDDEDSADVTRWNVSKYDFIFSIEFEIWLLQVG